MRAQAHGLALMDAKGEFVIFVASAVSLLAWRLGLLSD